MEAWGIIFAIMAVVGIIAIVVYIFYLVTLQNTLKAVSFENRKMSPGQVWLLLIPLFNCVWSFIVVNKISESLEAECRMRGIRTEPKPAYSVGIAMSVLQCCTWIPAVGYLVSIAALVCWIIYWIKVNEYKKLMESNPFVPGQEESMIFGNNDYKQ